MTELSLPHCEPLAKSVTAAQDLRTSINAADVYLSEQTPAIDEAIASEDWNSALALVKSTYLGLPNLLSKDSAATPDHLALLPTETGEASQRVSQAYTHLNVQQILLETLTGCAKRSVEMDEAKQNLVAKIDTGLESLDLRNITQLQTNELTDFLTPADGKLNRCAVCSNHSRLGEGSLKALATKAYEAVAALEKKAEFFPKAEKVIARVETRNGVVLRGNRTNCEGDVRETYRALYLIRFDHTPITEIDLERKVLPSDILDSIRVDLEKQGLFLPPVTVRAHLLFPVGHSKENFAKLAV